MEVKVKKDGHLIRFSILTSKKDGSEERVVDLDHYTIGGGRHEVVYDDGNVMVGRGESEYAEHEEEFYYIFLKGE